MLYSLIAVFQMYSRIPMPQIPWEERSRRYALCFFPLVGAVIGGMLCGWYWVCEVLSLPSAVFSVIAVCIPVLVTGGIHLDGFCDVEDARASFAEKTRKLEIMSDPHIGSFAVIHLALYVLVQAGFMASIRSFQGVLLTACTYIVSRTLSGLAAVTFRCAKKEGTLQSFVRPAHRRITIAVLACVFAISASGMLAISPFSAIVSLAAAGVVFACYRVYAYKTFGGITGDTAGWFLQKCELWMLIGIVIARIQEARG
ncbi:MAG: adenosylcobinamide-GDP ribazoletransferase [Oscillospiraceae bacterium]|nr:adenosylcobinamide-GDP ribazoletransferase [Oscillospiraceae bacterium]